MLRRVLALATVALLLLSVGCQNILRNDGSFSELKNHAIRLDHEFQNLHTDIKEIVFGLDVESSGAQFQLDVYK